MTIELTDPDLPVSPAPVPAPTVCTPVKPVEHSKTVLFNLLGGVAVILAMPELPGLLGPNYARYVVAAGIVINLYLRIMQTNAPLDLASVQQLLQLFVPGVKPSVPTPVVTPVDDKRRGTSVGGSGL